MRRREGDLFDLGEVVLGVAVESETAEGTEGDFALRPDFGEVEDVPAEFLGVAWGEDLEVTGPGRVVAFLDGVEEVLRMPVRVLGGHFARFLVVEGFTALIGLAVDLDIVEGTVRLGKFVGVAGVAIHMAIGIGGTTVREQMHDLMS